MDHPKPGYYRPQFLNIDFQWISKESDVLLQVHSPQDGQFLILNELQLRYDPRMPQRIRAYVALNVVSLLMVCTVI